MNTDSLRTLLIALAATAALSAGCRKEEPEAPEDLLLAGLADDEEAFAATLDASEAAVEGPSAFAPGSSSSFAGCTGSVTGSDVIAVCGRDVPGNRSITWSCTGPNGNGVSGAATITTTVLDDSACPDVTIQHEIDFSRTASVGPYTGHLDGTSTVTLTLDAANRSAQRTLQANLVRQVYRAEKLVRDQELTGTRVADLAANGAGLADDTRTVNGQALIEFKLAEATLTVDATNLLWQRGCCHPVGGAVEYHFAGNFSGDGTITFGPTCGEAHHADQSEVGLAACPQF